MDLREILKDIEVPVKVSYYKITFAYQSSIAQGPRVVMLPVAIGHFDWHGKVNPFLYENVKDLEELGKDHARTLSRQQAGSDFLSIEYFNLIGIIPII